MIYITGDTHGMVDFDKLRKYFDKKYVSRKDYLIILGDAGIVWDKNYKKTVDLYESLGLTIFFIDGNHENFDLLEKFPIIEKNNAHVHIISTYIFHILRSEILILNGLSFLCIGGANSIDRKYRKLGISYWKQEVIQPYEIDEAYYNLAKYHLKVNYVLSHCAPNTIVQKRMGFEIDESTIQLDRLCPHIETDKWYFGHYHIDRQFDEMFRCFYNDILEINKMDEGSKIIKYKELTRSQSFDDYVSYPYLINRETGRATKLIEEDLPEWYFHNYSYRDWYYCTKDVVDVAYSGSPFDNHISKDSRIYISFDKKIQKDKDYKPIKKEESNYINTWRCNIKEFALALEKYSPYLDLARLKEEINLTYDQYNRIKDNWHNSIYVRPFIEIQTRKIKDIKYSVIKDDYVLCDFYDLVSAKDFCEYYLKNNLQIEKYITSKDDNDYIYKYICNSLYEEIYIKKV